MNPAVKEKWLNALRSGKFSQAQRRLRKNGAYCCLGVLCELYRQEVGGEWRGDPDGYEDNGVTVFWAGRGHDYSATVLPAAVRKWAGLVNNSPAVRPDKEVVEVELAHLNDHGSSFAEIADLIEEHL